MRIIRKDIKTEDVVRLYESGLSIVNTAAELDVSEELVKIRLRSAGVKMRPKSRQTPEIIVEQIREMYAAGGTCKAISETFGLCEVTIRKYILQLPKAKKIKRGIYEYKGYRLYCCGYHQPDHCIWWEAVNIKTELVEYHATTKKRLMARIDAAVNGKDGVQNDS